MYFFRLRYSQHTRGTKLYEALSPYVEYGAQYILYTSSTRSSYIILGTQYIPPEYFVYRISIGTLNYKYVPLSSSSSSAPLYTVYLTRVFSRGSSSFIRIRSISNVQNTGMVPKLSSQPQAYKKKEKTNSVKSNYSLNTKKIIKNLQIHYINDIWYGFKVLYSVLRTYR